MDGQAEEGLAGVDYIILTPCFENECREIKNAKMTSLFRTLTDAINNYGCSVDSLDPGNIVIHRKTCTDNKNIKHFKLYGLLNG